MASCIVLPRTISACGSLQTLYLYKLAASWLSFCTLCLLFSIAYSLFGQKQGGGYTLQNRSFRISNIQTLFPRPVRNSVNGRPETYCAPPTLYGNHSCSAFVFRTIRIALVATPLFSRPYKTPGVWGLLFSPCAHKASPAVAAECNPHWHLARLSGVKASVRRSRP
jgi:hypothetical protein